MNWLQNVQFEIQIDRLQDFSFRANKVAIPQIDGVGPVKPTPFSVLPMTPDTLEYGPLSITSGMDEELMIWEAAFDWLMVGFPESYDQFGNSRYESRHHSDISVIILNNKKNAIGTFVFKNCIPINVGTMMLDATNSSQTVTEFTTDFKYDTFSFTRQK